MAELNCYNRIPLDQLLVNPSNAQSNKLRRRLLRDGIKEHKCESCGLSLWLDKPIPLELSHKDGDKHNCLLENLELICPNCHALTLTYRGKNINSYLLRRGGMAKLVDANGLKPFDESLAGSSPATPTN